MPLSRAVGMLVYRAGFRDYQEVIGACINLVTFLLLVTGFVYTAFFVCEPGINGFVDASFHRRHHHDHRLWRYHPARHAWQADIDCCDDIPDLTFCAPCLRGRPAQQGPLSLLGLRPQRS